jgi:anti-sigma-K factor RskA
MSTVHVSDSIPAYALDILEKAERELIARHLAHCTACQDELSAYRAVMEYLPGTVSQKTPPLRLRSAILQKAAGSTSTPHSLWARWAARLTQPLHPAVGLIGLVLIVALAGLNLTLWQQTQHPANEFRLVNLTSPQGDKATGLMIISEDGSFGTLVVDDLKPLSSEQQYQLWLIKDGKRTSGGVFSVQDSGYGVLRVDAPMPLITYPAFGITIEPTGGSSGPTGPKVLGGNL